MMTPAGCAALTGAPSTQDQVHLDQQLKKWLFSAPPDEGGASDVAFHSAGDRRPYTLPNCNHFREEIADRSGRQETVVATLIKIRDARDLRPQFQEAAVAGEAVGGSICARLRCIEADIRRRDCNSLSTSRDRRRPPLAHMKQGCLRPQP
jgi:hypothetical protein